MNINWKKWILERLPFSLRVNRIYVFCLLLTLPIRQLHSSFARWSKKLKGKAGASVQVCMLKKIIYDEIGSNIEIDEGDGKPYDFIVRTSLDNLDGKRRMIALLDRYKAAGKSYMYVNELVSYESLWGEHVCEICEYSAEWTSDGWVCELRQKEIITIEVDTYYWGDKGMALSITSSGLPREIFVYATGYGGGEWVIELPAGYTGPRTFRHNNFDLARLGVSPREDINYIYQLKAN